ncbi:helix-turn-helix transcriptional regulator [Sagittula sp. NFXS13]
MERSGLIERHVESVVPPADYSLTPLGRRFVGLVDLVYDWGRQNADALDEMQARATSRRVDRVDRLSVKPPRSEHHGSGGPALPRAVWASAWRGSGLRPECPLFSRGETECSATSPRDHEGKSGARPTVRQ